MKELGELKDEVIDILLTKKNVDFNYELGIISCLKTVEQAQELLDWIEKNPQAKIGEIALKAMEISNSRKQQTIKADNYQYNKKTNLCVKRIKHLSKKVWRGKNKEKKETYKNILIGMYFIVDSAHIFGGD